MCNMLVTLLKALVVQTTVILKFVWKDFQLKIYYHTNSICNAKAVRFSNLNHPGKKKKVSIQHNFHLYLKLLYQAQTISGKSVYYN